MSNVETFRSAHDAFNRRDWAAVVEHFADDAEYTDHARGVTLKGPQEFVDYLKGTWVTALSDAAVTKASYIDADTYVIARFTGTGTNDGPLGPMPATGRRLSVRFCEIMRFNEQGQIVNGGLYYDQLSLLIQAGHFQPPQ